MGLQNFLENEEEPQIVETEEVVEPQCVEKLKQNKITRKKNKSEEIDLTEQEKKLVRNFIQGEKDNYRKIEEIWNKYKDKQIKEQYFLDYLNECNKDDDVNLEKLTCSKKMILRRDYVSDVRKSDKRNKK